MKFMTLEQISSLINPIVDQLLVTMAENPESRYLYTLPSLTEEYQGETLMDCQENGYCIAHLREVITYKYLLGAMKSKLLEVNKENLYACLSNMRKSPVIDYYDLADYHEYAYYYYKKSENEKKANAHLLACYFDRGRAILSCDNTFDCKELLLVLLKDRQRLLSFLLYVIDFISHDFEDYQDFFKRSQYLLFERSLVLAEKVFAENATCDVNLRCCIYYVQSIYYNLTKRSDMALSAKRAYRKLGGKKSYHKLLEDIIATRLNPHWMDMRFLDYMLYANSVEDDEICTRDEDGNISLEIEEDEYSVWEKQERLNFMDAFYRPITEDMDFKKIYDQAEKGDQQAIREVARRYREGDGVTACMSAAMAWENKLTSLNS